MSKEQLVRQALTTAESIVNLDFTPIEELETQYAEWNSQTKGDFINCLGDLKNTLKTFESEGEGESVLNNIPFNILKSLVSQLQAVLTHCNNFLNQKTQQQFHQAFQQVETCRTQVQTWGLDKTYYLVRDLESKSQLLDDEIQKFLAHNRDVEVIKQNVGKLIEPAVAGSLSKSFENRRNDLNSYQSRWFIVSVIMALVSIGATFMTVSSVIGIFENEEIITLIQNSKNGSGIIWYSVLLRIGILIPIFSLFAFSFGQYRKERSLEEIYAHKAAVATSLPNYGDLAVDNEVKDQILSEASKVIFTSPSNTTEPSHKNENIVLDQVNQLMNQINKLVPKPKD